MIWRTVALLVGLAGPVQAGWSCDLMRENCEGECQTANVRFHIDPNQFVAPQNPNEPPRRQVTQVTMDRALFRAEAILMQSGAEGFYADAEAMGRRLMIVQPDGRARLTMQPQNITLTGQCTRVEGP